MDRMMGNANCICNISLIPGWLNMDYNLGILDVLNSIFLLLG